MNCVILNEHRRLCRRSVERARPASVSGSRMRASFHRRPAAEPTSSQPAPPQSDCRRLARDGAGSPLLSVAPAWSVAQPEQLILLRLLRSCEAFAGMVSRAASSLNRSSASRAPQIRSTQTLSAWPSALASRPEAALRRSKREGAAPSRLAPHSTSPFAGRPTGPPASASQPEAALKRSKREGAAAAQLALYPA